MPEPKLDKRIYAPAAGRNKEPISQVLHKVCAHTLIGGLISLVVVLVLVLALHAAAGCIPIEMRERN